MGNKSKHFIYILFAFTETQWNLLFSLSRCTMIVRWREEATSQNTPHTHWHTNKHSFTPHTHWHTNKHSLTLLHSYLWASLSCQSWNINPISVNRTCPIQVLHSTPTHQKRSMLSTEQLSANTINGVSKNSRTCQIIESNTKPPLSPN